MIPAKLQKLAGLVADPNKQILFDATWMWHKARFLLMKSLALNGGVNIVIDHWPMHLTDKEVEDCGLFVNGDLAAVNVQDQARLASYGKWLRILDDWTSLRFDGALLRLETFINNPRPAAQFFVLDWRWTNGLKAYCLDELSSEEPSLDSEDSCKWEGLSPELRWLFKHVPDFNLFIVFYLFPSLGPGHSGSPAGWEHCPLGIQPVKKSI